MQRLGSLKVLFEVELRALASLIWEAISERLANDHVGCHVNAGPRNTELLNSDECE